MPTQTRIMDTHKARNTHAHKCHKFQVSAKMMAPIIPHTSEHIWTTLLKHPGSVLNSGWPQGDAPDFILEVLSCSR